MFNDIFELLTTAADITQFIQLRKQYLNHDKLDIMAKLDKQDDIIFAVLVQNQQRIIKLLEVLIMDVRKMLDKIISDGDTSSMHMLNDTFISMLNTIKYTDHEEYKNIKYKLCAEAYDNHLSEEMAKCWVSEMKNKDGTHGEHWKYDETSSLLESEHLKYCKADFYAVLNMVYSDYYRPEFTVNDYKKLAIDWLDDEDVDGGKTLKYYMFVVC